MYEVGVSVGAWTDCAMEGDVGVEFWVLSKRTLQLSADVGPLGGASGCSRDSDGGAREIVARSCR